MSSTHGRRVVPGLLAIGGLVLAGVAAWSQWPGTRGQAEGGDSTEQRSRVSDGSVVAAREPPNGTGGLDDVPEAGPTPGAPPPATADPVVAEQVDTTKLQDRFRFADGLTLPDIERPPMERLPPLPALGGDVGLAALGVYEKAVQSDSPEDPAGSAAAWSAVARHEHMPEATVRAAESRSLAWAAVVEVRGARRERIRAAAARRAVDAERLAKILAFEDRVVTRADKAAARDAFERAYAPWMVHLAAGLKVIDEWVRIPEGSFQMGSESGDEKPVRTVRVGDFWLSKTEVTVGQYRACVRADVCREPFSDGSCNWGRSGREDHPVNCVKWEDASVFAAWAGGRLPSEAEWEYAARSGGKGREYPWGEEEPDCDRAVRSGCGGSTAEVCSKRAGNTAQGLCDMAGNVSEWVADWYGPYGEAPNDGSARTETARYWVSRGGSWNDGAGSLRAASRGRNSPLIRSIFLGFRVARASP